jgi:TolB protein
MSRLIWLPAIVIGALFVVWAQDPDIRVRVTGGGELPTMAIPDFRGSGEAQAVMPGFNQTLWGDISGSGYLKMAPKTMYPLFIPQQPSDFTPAPASPQSAAAGRLPSGGGHWMTDWSGPPVSATYMAFGYTAVQNGVLVLQGWLYDLTHPASPQMLGSRYTGSPDEAGARKVAHEFAADILSKLGAQSLYGTHIYFVSSRTGNKEIWAMDPDGKNQRQITHLNSISIEPAISPDGARVAFTSFRNSSAGIFVYSVDPVRDLRFYNQSASVNSSPSFTPDGKSIVYSSSAGGSCCRIFIAGLNGSGFRPITSLAAIDTEPKVNPKTGAEIVFTSGRSGAQQVYKMNMDGADMERLTDGTGEAGNAAWNPDGQHIAYAWTRGYAAGAWNIFWMDVATRRYVQLTHGDGKNEQPNWAPDGTHLVFAKSRGGSYQIYSMLADGSQVQQLTTLGSNDRPVWGK